MEILEGALIILLSVIINAIGTLIVLKLYLIKLNIQPFIKMGKAFASQMGTRSQQVQHTAKQKALAEEAKKRVAEAAIEELPLGSVLKRVMERAGLSGNEIFALIQDQEFMKGVQVILGTFSGALNKLTGKEEQKKLELNPQGYIGGGGG